MILIRHIILIIVSSASLFANSFGYLRVVEASFCMDECAQYMLQSENGDFITFLANTNNIDLAQYIDRYVEVLDGGEFQCIECSAMIIGSIYISDACDYPVQCFADPCEVADECQLNTPVECVSNYCDGCYADFYDLDGNLVDCYNTLDCTDLFGISFGMCDMWLGIAYVDGECQGLSGCGWEVGGVDYSDAFFDSIAECQSTCIDNQLTCYEIESQYNELHLGEYITCMEDSDCTAIWGDCSVGLGGCHYSVNDIFDYNQSSDLVEQWVDNECMEWVCDCLPLPNPICVENQCDLTYCDAPDPSGCYSSGCNDGYECIDFGNQVYDGFCVPSSCVCNEDNLYEAYWSCTEDCNGGTCVPEEPQPGDLCVFDYNLPGLHWPGFVDCNGECLEYGYYDWLGDGWCDDGWGYSFNCEALDFDNGDCINNCNSGDVNADGIINILDIVLIVDCILDDNTCLCSDINNDGITNVLDIIIIINIILNP